jgi:hypothetical protein
MTTGMLGEDQGLLTKQDAADLLQVAVDAASLAAEGHWAALSGGSADWCATGKPPSNDGSPEASRPDPQTRTAGNVFLRCAVLITQESAGQHQGSTPGIAAVRQDQRRAMLGNHEGSQR